MAQVLQNSFKGSWGLSLGVQEIEFIEGVRMTILNFGEKVRDAQRGHSTLNFGPLLFHGVIR